MSAVNKVYLSGRVGKDPEVRHLDSGKMVANFSMATTEKYNGEENTEWHNCVVWGKLAEIVSKFVTKGMEVSVWGKLQTRSWDDKDGNKKYTTEINLDELRMHGGKQQSKSNNASHSNMPETNDKDELPW